MFPEGEARGKHLVIPREKYMPMFHEKSCDNYWTILNLNVIIRLIIMLKFTLKFYFL